MRALYFVDSIHIASVTEENAGEAAQRQEATLSLIGVVDGMQLEGEENENVPIMLTLHPSQLQYDRRGGNIREGWYVYYNDAPSNGELFFSYGNTDSYAKEQIALNDNLRHQLQVASAGFLDVMTAEYLDVLLHLSTVRSYHVNVGHGNCSFLVIQYNGIYELWCIDCSLHEKPNKIVGHTYHLQSFDKCMQSIAGELGIDVQDLRINRFFLTHMHYDHFNGMRYLINKGYLYQNTICYINLNYQMPSKNFNIVLQLMMSKGINKIVEPLSTTGNAVIQIYYPDRHLFRSQHTVNTTEPYRVEKNVNDSSTVIRFNLGNHSMVFTGDIEQDGIKEMASYMPYAPFCLTDIYAISHHGSETGHPLNINVMPWPFQGLRCCPWISIIMGRDGAYNGIVSPKVVNDFCAISRLVTTDDLVKGQPISFVTINWENGQIDKIN